MKEPVAYYLSLAEGPPINGRIMSHDFIGACPKPAKYLRLKIHKCMYKSEKPPQKIVQ